MNITDNPTADAKEPPITDVVTREHPANDELLIRIENLCVSYQPGKNAVENVSANIYDHEITAMHPQKGIQGIGGLSMQDITNAFHARVLSFRFTHSEHSTAPIPFARGRCHAGNITLFRPHWSQHNCRLQKPQRQWLHRSGSPRS